MPSKFGGIAVEDEAAPQTKSKFGGIPVEETPADTPSPKAPGMGAFQTARAIAPALLKSATETGKGFAKQIGSDIYGLATGPLAGPLGVGLGYLGEKTGITKKVDALTAKSNPLQKAGGYLATGAEFAIPGPAEAVPAKGLGRLGRALSESAEKQYSQVLNATTRGNKMRSAKVVPEMIDRGVKALTLKGLGRKTSEGLATATEKLEDAYAGLPPNAAIPADKVVNGLTTSAKDMFTAGGKSMSPQSDTALNLAKELGDRLMDQAVTDPATRNKVIPVDVARKTRQIYDEIARAAGRYEGKALADHSSGLVHGMAADSIREMLNQVSAGSVNIGEVNKEYNFWRNADTVVQETLLRKQGQARPLGQKIAQGAGAVLGFGHGGFKGAALGYEAMRAVEAATTSAAWRTTSAVMKNRLAKSLASGNQAASTAIANAIAKGVVIEEARSQPGEPRDRLGKELPNTFETRLSPDQEKQFSAWKQKNAPNDTGEDYDLRGAFASSQGTDARGHMTDQFKKPNHPTFSTDSQYSGQGGNGIGGRWAEENGKTVFYASPANLKYRNAQELEQYFKEQEPDAILVLPH